MVTFAQFQASGRDVADVRSIVGDDMDGVAVPGRVYDGDAYIQPCGAGQYTVEIYNCAWTGSRDMCESILYFWCLTEWAETMGISEDLRLTLCYIENVAGTEVVAAAIRSHRCPDEFAGVPDCAIHAYAKNRKISPNDDAVNLDDIGVIVGQVYAIFGVK